MAARAHRYHLPATASRYSSARWHFLLHVSFSVLHARHLSRRFAADKITARFCPGGLFFPSAGRWTNCSCRRFSSATCHAAGFARRSVFVGIVAMTLGLFEQLVLAYTMLSG